MSEAYEFPFRLVNFGTPFANARTPVIIRQDYAVCTIEYVTAGGGFLVSDGQSAEIDADGIYFLHKHSNHTYYPRRTAPWHKLCLVVDGTLMEALFHAYGLDRVIAIAAVPELKRFFTLMMHQELCTPAGAPRAALIFHEFVAAAAHLAAPRKKSGSKQAEMLKNHLDRDYGTHFSLSDYATAHTVSATALIRSFRRSYGATPVEYRMTLRVKAAAELLAYSDLSIKEIAAQLGFADQYYFSNCFKARIGLAPTRYRLAIASGASDPARQT